MRRIYQSIMATVQCPPRVVVVGAGVSGLAAAKELKEAGADVVVLEARDRLGGRIWTERFSDGTAVDMGAAWLHGHSSKNPLTKLAADMGATLVETDWDHRTVCFPATGSASGPPEANHKWLLDDDWIQAEDAFERSWQLFKQVQAKRRREWPSTPDESLWDEVLKLRSHKFPGVLSLPERVRSMVRFLWAERSEHDYAAALEDLSFTWWDIDECTEGPDCLWQKGYVQFAEYLAASGGSEPPDHIRLQSCVDSIHVVENEAAEVVLNTGERLPCAAVVCTLPLGILKAGRVKFDPPLPSAKLTSMQRLDLGVLNKVALRFDKCFWDSLPASSSAEQLSEIGLGELAASMECHGIARVTCSDARCQSSAMESPFWVNLLPVTGSNVLVAYFAAGAAANAESKSDEELVEHCLTLLKSMISPEVIAGANVLEFKISRWQHDEYSLGSYSYLPVGALPEDREELAKAEGPIFFAGEATETKFPSTVHGAYRSGLRAAKEVSDFLKLHKKKPRRGRGKKDAQKTPS